MFLRDHGHTDWFHVDIPLTADKIRMAARDEIVEMAEKRSKNLSEMEKLAYQV